MKNGHRITRYQLYALTVKSKGKVNRISEMKCCKAWEVNIPTTSQICTHFSQAHFQIKVFNTNDTLAHIIEP